MGRCFICPGTLGGCPKTYPFGELTPLASLSFWSDLTIASEKLKKLQGVRLHRGGQTVALSWLQYCALDALPCPEYKTQTLLLSEIRTHGWGDGRPVFCLHCPKVFLNYHLSIVNQCKRHKWFLRNLNPGIHPLTHLNQQMCSHLSLHFFFILWWSHSIFLSLERD